MKGEILLETAEGAGACFTLTSPCPAIADGPAGSVAAAAADPGAIAGLRVLACDDNEINRMVLDGFLNQLPIETQIVPDGPALLEAAGSGGWDVCLIDIVMPGMSGLETLAELRRREREQGRAPVDAIACTAHAMRTQVDEYLAAGFDGHLAKPIDVASLATALADAARRRADRGVSQPLVARAATGA